MDIINIILLVFLSGAILTAFVGKLSSIVQDAFFLITIVVTSVLFFLNMDTNTEVILSLSKYQLVFGLTPLSLFFAFIVFGLAVLTGVYAIGQMQGKKKKGYFYFNFLLSIAAMFGILVSKDLVSFFIFWEIMTWSSYLLVIYNGKDVQKIGIKYFVMSAIGAYAMMMAIVIIHSLTGSFLISDMINGFDGLSSGMKLLIPILLLIGFGVKAALMPLHIWAPDAYSNSPMSYTAIFSGALSKMGIYGMVIVFMALITKLPHESLIRDIIAWLGAITAAISTLWAIKQDDAKKLLAYSSIGQLGYIIIGVAIGTPLAMLAGLFLAFMHGVFKSTLFMVVGAIEKQTGTSKFTEVTGLIRKMPWTFLVSMISIIALAGIPPLGGFVGKWMLYESMITSNHYLLVILVFFSSTAAFLYCYKFLFGFFLGQEEKEWSHVKEAPAIMVVPMLFSSLLSIVLGTYPQLILKPINSALAFYGMPDTYSNLWSESMIFNKWGDQVALAPIMYAVMAVFIIVAIFLFFKNRKSTRYVTTKDISTSGEIIKEHENLTFKENFFQPFLRAVEPAMRRQIDKYMLGFARGLEDLFEFTRRIYTGNGQLYAIYALVFLIILLVLSNNLFG
jgi:NADH-quinone oxidoreductase subunit M